MTKNDDLSGFYKIFWLKTFNCILIDVAATFLFPHKIQAFKIDTSTESPFHFKSEFKAALERSPFVLFLAMVWTPAEMLS